MTIQDLGRVGLAHIGIPRAGAIDASSLRLANRLVGNSEGAAGLEATLGNCVLRPRHAVTLAITGARCAVSVDGRPRDWGLPIDVSAEATVTIGPASVGLRVYIAVSGGIVVPPVLGSRSTDTLSGIGPPPVRDGDVLPIGPPAGLPPGVDVAPYAPPPQVLTVRISLGPRDHWFTEDAIQTLSTGSYAISTMTDRVAARLVGPVLARSVTDELPSEGVVLGAIQVPADGQPLIFLADHPTTGGYPVVAVAHPDDLCWIGQARPGTPLRFSLMSQPEVRTTRQRAANGRRRT
jgi:biotin-dependent carboxylase-like uncharacterized protein